MGLRQPLRPLIGWLVFALLAGCSSTGTVPLPSPKIAVDPPPADDLWSGPKTPRTTAPVPVLPVVSSPPPAPAPASHAPTTLAVAVEQASSSYEQGLQAMRHGDKDRAEWEFDVALATLLDANVAGNGPTHLRSSALPPAPPPPDRVASLLLPQRPLILPSPSPALTAPQPPILPPAEAPVTSEASPATAQPFQATQPPEGAPEDETPLEAPALLSPEDLDEVEGEKPEDTTGLPEPDSQKHDIPLVFNEQVRAFVYYFQTRKYGMVSRAFERASRYMPMMRQVFDEEGLPQDLINLSFIESAVNPWATSRARAAGMWQFMPATGRLFGMEVSWWLDERRDPEKSTRGAAKYLKKLYEMFEDWPLALAAYNVGEGAIQNAIRRQNTRNFWALRLPKETKHFVPAFMAMTIISREPDRYGFSPPPDGPAEVEHVTLHHPADLKVLAQAAGATVEELRGLNPALIRWATPPGGPFTLRIPGGRREAFDEHLERIPPDQRTTWIRHTIRKGETPSGIARRYGVDVQTVLDLNGLRKRQPLKAGSALRLPPVPTPAFLVQAEAKQSRRTAATASAKRPTQVTVKRGDTLERIARAHAVSTDNLRRWNALSSKAPLRPGQRLVVSAPQLARDSGTRPVLASAKARPAPKTYVVKRGDTLERIARAHAVSADELRRWNQLPPKAALRPGQALRVDGPAS